MALATVRVKAALAAESAIAVVVARVMAEVLVVAVVVVDAGMMTGLAESW